MDSTDLDKARGSVKSGFGGSPFGSAPAIPAEFSPLVSAHQTVNKLSVPLKATLTAADQEYEKQTDPATAPPSAPVYAARLNGLLRTLANAESAVAECVKARQGLISGLEKMLEANRAALESDRDAQSNLSQRKQEIEDKKQQVEVAIMRALDPSEGNGSTADDKPGNTDSEAGRPEMEALTPPPMESFTPPSVEGLTPPPMDAEDSLTGQESATGADSNAGASYQSVPVSTNGSNKRRRVEDSGDFPDFGADEDIDPEVAEMLRKEDS
jgi:regulator of Ty1 transposition protein 103